IAEKCEERMFTLILRRFMMRLAQETARRAECTALLTGESLGQVASQTMEAIICTDALAPMPVFRPCIGLDKEEIIQIARRIGTFDISSLPYEDCCTVFTPRHPKLDPTVEELEAEEAKLDIKGLTERAMQTLSFIRVHGDERLNG
ncbi:MAG: tRNA 4-thiouridine(8) synthase ThiI, partial [Clostridia bacterium]|nr:tRNA 4-thiouridine(8) synthase ThiI [Clostridia bacterium]